MDLETSKLLFNISDFRFSLFVKVLFLGAKKAPKDFAKDDSQQCNDTDVAVLQWPCSDAGSAPLISTVGFSATIFLTSSNSSSPENPDVYDALNSKSVSALSETSPQWHRQSLYCGTVHSSSIEI
ncbi:hypothetical protein VNO80_13000 [Phaseolus coccineus]|uniref:Uncharacterized protein n=1 Tax=Phaseolus coccineus TaxID=3886 RepID=A0AAN9N6W1_PHACN